MRLALSTLAIALAAAPPGAQQLGAQQLAPASDVPSLDGLRAGVARPAASLAPAPVTLAPADTGRKRAVEHSDLYYKRLAVHRYTSYAMLPLFAAQYVLGDRLIDARENGGEASSSTRNLHSTVAGGIAAVFAVNTVTGAWNWWDERKETEGRTKRTIHSLLMTAAGAGFVATGITAGEAEDEGEGEGEGNANTHRNLAIGSMAIATAGAALMWFWKD